MFVVLILFSKRNSETRNPKFHTLKFHIKKNIFHFNSD